MRTVCSWRDWDLVRVWDSMESEVEDSNTTKVGLKADGSIPEAATKTLM